MHMATRIIVGASDMSFTDREGTRVERAAAVVAIALDPAGDTRLKASARGWDVATDAITLATFASLQAVPGAYRVQTRASMQRTGGSPVQTVQSARQVGDLSHIGRIMARWSDDGGDGDVVLIIGAITYPANGTRADGQAKEDGGWVVALSGDWSADPLTGGPIRGLAAARYGCSLPLASGIRTVPCVARIRTVERRSKRGEVEVRLSGVDWLADAPASLEPEPLAPAPQSDSEDR